MAQIYQELWQDSDIHHNTVNTVDGAKPYFLYLNFRFT